MKLRNTVLVVKNLEQSKRFYRDVLGLHVLMDVGPYVTLTNGIRLQSLESWESALYLPKDRVSFGGLDGELYFEEKDFDRFLEKLGKLSQLDYIHPVMECRWGQRVVRLYDPDLHVVEVGENLKSVCKRFLDSGMTVEEVAKRMGVSAQFVRACNRCR